MPPNSRALTGPAARSALFLLGVAALLLAATRVEADRRPIRRVAARPHAPNVLILIGDDHAGGTLGIDGDPRQATPNLDRLARQGVRFDRAYCNSPVCTPSRQSFVTGRLPHAVGVTRLETPLPESAITLGDWWGDRGYETAAFGKMHFNGRGRHGFDRRLDTRNWRRHLFWHPPEGGDRRRPWRPFASPAAEWLNADVRPAGLPAASMEATYYADEAADYLRARRDRPFALIVSFYEPHAPFRFPDDWPVRYRPDDFAAPAVTEADRLDQPRVFAGMTPDQVRGVAAAYYSSLSWMDAAVGRVLEALEDSGHAEDTIVVYSGDNGYLLGQHGRLEKHSVYEPAVRVPLIVRWPGHLPEGRRVPELVELVDVLPTLAEFCGLPDPPDLHGRSLAGLLRGDPGATGREVAVSVYHPAEEAMARSDRYKLVVASGRRRRDDGYASGRPPSGPSERLYDLETDPGETTDLSGRPDLAPVADRLRRALFERLTTTRLGLRPVPEGLTEPEAIRWCLAPRDDERPRPGALRIPAD